jgi:hypothetical protein
LEGITVICKTISDFRDYCFKEGDKFRYAVIVPKQTLSKLENTSQYEYVKISSPKSESDGTLAQIITFSEDHDLNEFSTDGGDYYSCVRTKLQREIGLEPDNDDEDIPIEIRECDTETSDPLKIRRVSAWEQETRDITTEGLAGYMIEDKINDIEGLNVGDVCELIDPRTGARIQLPIEAYRHKQRNKNTIRLNGITRNLLHVDSKDEGEKNTIRLRVLTKVNEKDNIINRLKVWIRYRLEGLNIWIGRRFVDYSYSHFRVLRGYNRDEGRNVIRMNEDAMKGLGIEENDRVIISWIKEKKKIKRNVRCQSGWEEDRALEPAESSESSDGETESLSIRVPSTERDNLSISVGDSISVRRDMRYQAGKQVALSAFGILGVIVGTNQLINMIFDQISIAYIGTSIFSILVLSVATVWLIMSPIRQKCQVPE